MRRKTSGFAEAMYAGGLVLLLLACLPLAAALLVFGRAALLAMVPVFAIAAGVAWAMTPGNLTRALGAGEGGRAS
jgi:hypothetical protein